MYMLLSNFKRSLCKTIFISHHAMCSPISSYCCNHFSSMLMSVKLIVIQLELNDIVYKLIFQSYSKFCIKHMIHINIRKETKIIILIVFQKLKKLKKRKKEKIPNFFFLFLKNQKKGKQSNRKEKKLEIFFQN